MNARTGADPSMEPAADPAAEASWVTAWTGDPEIVEEVIFSPSGGCRLPGIAFEDERPGDRDHHDVLLSRGRLPAMPGGRGKPRHGSMILNRQRRAMRPGRLLCQVTGNPAHRNAEGWLWLLPGTAAGRDNAWPEREFTAHPPVSLKGMAWALRRDPELAEHSTAVRVRAPRLHGVMGDLWGRDLARPGFPFPVVVKKAVVVAYNDSDRLPWVLAEQRILYLGGCTITDIHAELAAAGEL